MKKIPLLFCLVVFLAGFASAQNQTCPKINVSGGGVVAPGDPMSFTVYVEGDESGKLSFDWQITTGKIIEGQGTSTITVLKNDVTENLTATVKIKGLPEGCPNTDSETYLVEPPRRVAVLNDEFGSVPNGEIRYRMDTLFIAMGNQPNAQGYIINYGTNKEISNREKLLRYHIAFKKYDASRVTFVRGGANPRGEKGAWTKLWIVPPGAEPPTP